LRKNEQKQIEAVSNDCIHPGIDLRQRHIWPSLLATDICEQRTHRARVQKAMLAVTESMNFYRYSIALSSQLYRQ